MEAPGSVPRRWNVSYVEGPIVPPRDAADHRIPEKRISGYRYPTGGSCGLLTEPD